LLLLIKLTTVTGLTSSTDYTFTVKAIGNNGIYLPQLMRTATKRTAPTTNLQASATTSSSTVLNWTAPTDVTDVVGYNVYNGTN
jgi:chitin-binding protein